MMSLQVKAWMQAQEDFVKEAAKQGKEDYEVLLLMRVHINMYGIYDPCIVMDEGSYVVRWSEPHDHIAALDNLDMKRIVGGRAMEKSPVPQMEELVTFNKYILVEKATTSLSPGMYYSEIKSRVDWSAPFVCIPDDSATEPCLECGGNCKHQVAVMMRVKPVKSLQKFYLWAEEDIVDMVYGADLATVYFEDPEECTQIMSATQGAGVLIVEPVESTDGQEVFQLSLASTDLYPGLSEHEPFATLQDGKEPSKHGSNEDGSGSPDNSLPSGSPPKDAAASSAAAHQ